VLRDRPLIGFLLITDAARAKKFYCDVLGLPMRDEDEYAVVVDAAGTPLRLAVVPRVPEPAGTNAGWLVDDVNASVRALAAAGIAFERFPGMEQDADGVWRSSPEGGGVAWFRDPDGNRLSVSQNPSTPLARETTRHD
jgi:catechol 2,3-dioxygenase-like lactoylglutathione lyase family enzyme